jgi:glycosyltransferase involved in cell wall biosynthesis
VKKSLADRLKELDNYFFTIPGFATNFHVQNLLVKGWGYQGLFHAILTRLRWLSPTMKMPGAIATIEYWLMDNRVFMKAKKIICVTRLSYEFYKAKFRDKAIYIPPPIECFTVERKPAEKLRILFVSRDLTIPRKNLITLLRALNMLNRKHLRKTRLILVGRNPHTFADWLNYLEKNGVKIDVYGYVNNDRMADIYSDADVLVCLSYYEELGYVILEAMAYGLPVIASNIPSFNDMIKDGYNGFLIEPDDYQKLANILRYLIENRESCYKMGKKSLEIIKEKFNPKLVAQRIKKHVVD